MLGIALHGCGHQASLLPQKKGRNMDIIEKVAEGLYQEYMRGRYCSVDHNWEDYKFSFPDSAELFMRKAHQICNLAETKVDENRLLTDETIKSLWKVAWIEFNVEDNFMDEPNAVAVIKSILGKQLALDQIHEEAVIAAKSIIFAQASERAAKEQIRAVVERIFLQSEKGCVHNKPKGHQVITRECPDCWQTLKDKELGK